MRALTPSGSRVTSMPPTVAVPDVGASRPQSIRIVVDLPAPLLPRKPKISPRPTSKLTLSTATNWPNRRVNPRTSMAVELLANGSLQPGFREPHVRERARAIELGLQTRDLRVEHVGRRGDAGAVALGDDALGLERGAHLVAGRVRRLAARGELQRAGAHLERDVAIETADARPQGGCVR